MNPLEPKPPDPCSPAFSFPSWTILCPFLPNIWPKVPGFFVSFSYPASSLRAIDARFGISSLGWGMVFKRSSRFAPHFRIRSTRVEQQVLKFHIVKPCSFSTTIGVPRQETQGSLQ
uniref:Uncharacterized protein n=1 Tax=Opuntia streptacantha TaxID=393608 RepID=A0A7C9AF26_OPUST